ncbi:amino acid permease [Virgibacillus dokdonensis]|nr:amino acid permease [Virgibacillus sp.]
MKKGQMNWWQLSLLGVGCTIGTGFFLGSSMAIKNSGPAVIVAFVLAAAGTFIVYDSLASMSVDDPNKGSFRYYSQKAFGSWAGFSNGWVYAFSEILIMGSQLIALGIFTQFWFPNVSLWLLCAIYGALGLLVILTGMKGFEKIEGLFGVMKTAAILMFIFVAVFLLVTFAGGESLIPSFNKTNLFSEGPTGVWHALIYAFYAFGGVEVMGLLVIDLKKPKEAPKAGRVMMIALTAIYIISISLILVLVSWQTIHANESPFITALKPFSIPYVTDIFTGVFIIAGFSTMVAALFAVLTILVSLAEDHHAPSIFQHHGKWNVPWPAFLCTTGGLVVSVIIALVLPERLFEYVTTAAGLMLLYNWMFILATFLKQKKQTGWQKIKPLIGMLLITIAVSGTWVEKTSRIGFFVSFVFICFIALATFLSRSTRQHG